MSIVAMYRPTEMKNKIRIKIKETEYKKETFLFAHYPKKSQSNSLVLQIRMVAMYRPTAINN